MHFILAMTVTFHFQGQVIDLLHIRTKYSIVAKQQINIDRQTASIVAIIFYLVCSLATLDIGLILTRLAEFESMKFVMGVLIGICSLFDEIQNGGIFIIFLCSKIAVGIERVDSLTQDVVDRLIKWSCLSKTPQYMARTGPVLGDHAHQNREMTLLTYYNEERVLILANSTQHLYM